MCKKPKSEENSMMNNTDVKKKAMARSSVQDAALVGANFTQAGLLPGRGNNEARVTLQKFSSLRGYEVAVSLNSGKGVNCCFSHIGNIFKQQTNTCVSATHVFLQLINYLVYSCVFEGMTFAEILAAAGGSGESGQTPDVGSKLSNSLDKM